MENSPLRIAILGTRGVPACYGGFETFAEEISSRLADRGHEITVYGRKGPSLTVTKGKHGKVRTLDTPTIYHKYLETPLASISGFLHCLTQSYDIILLCNAANSPFAWLGRLKCPVLINVDGIERLRSKWNAVGRLWYRIGERCSVLFASTVIADAEVIAEYYQERYGCESQVLAYGASATHLPVGETLKDLNLEPNNYLLYVSRIEPENNALGVIQAYCMTDISMPLVIVGDAPYADEYKQQLREAAKGRNVVFAGYRFGEAYQELRSHCVAYVQATEVGGTHPALIEGMAYGNCVIANGTPENIEVLGDAGLIYSKNDFNELAQLLTKIESDSELRASLGEAARARAEERYSWNAVTDQYERLFIETVANRQGARIVEVSD